VARADGFLEVGRITFVPRHCPGTAPALPQPRPSTAPAPTWYLRVAMQLKHVLPPAGLQRWKRLGQTATSHVLPAQWRSIHPLLGLLTYIVVQQLQPEATKNLKSTDIVPR
jgi:hypothetical protein